MRKTTKLVHGGRRAAHPPGTVNLPVARASTVLFESLAHLAETQKLFEAGERIATYGIVNMPQRNAFEELVCELEGGHRAVTVPSGLAAVAVAIMAVVKAGDHVLMVDSVYGPSRTFCDRTLARFGVETSYYDPLASGEQVGALMRPNTTAVYVESPGSLTFEVQDIPAIAAAAHAHGAKVVLDNTWATPLGFRAFDHGVDVSVHAATKYIGGHSDVLLGLILANESTYGPLFRFWTDTGVTASPDDCFLALRGLRTLAVRLDRHRASAMTIARWLAGRPEVREVLYPALPGAPGHALWQRDFVDASGLFGVVLQPVAAARIAAMLDGMALFGMGWSWGGFESLIIPTYPERVRTATPWQPGGPCLRLAIGLEAPEDLIADLDAGFARLAG